MDYKDKTFSSPSTWKDYSSYYLGIDIGGTNTNLAVAGVNNSELTMLFSLHFQTKQLPNLVPAVNTTSRYAADKYDIVLTQACIGAAGVVNRQHDFVQLTNASWSVSLKELLKETTLKSASLVNDFQLIGYGLNVIDHTNKDHIVPLQQSKQQDQHQVKAVIGAGTGLGKTIMTYDKKNKVHVPIPTEGGHADVSLYSHQDVDCAYFIRRWTRRKEPVRYEDILSGSGLELLYQYVRATKNYTTTKYTKEIDKSKEKAQMITKYAAKDDTCKAVMDMFLCYYARCAKNFALDTLPRSGLYIAGGIAAKNSEYFTASNFLDEFHKSSSRDELLKSLPLYLITCYDISLYGACFAAQYQSQMKA